MPTRRVLLRRAALLPLLAAPLSGCGMFDDMFADNKIPLPGHREDVPSVTSRSLKPDLDASGTLALPQPVRNANWPQAGGDATHSLGHVAGGGLQQAWSADIGEGGGYRSKITADPIVAQGRVFTMDSDGQVSAFETATGHKIWEQSTKPKKNRSSNVGGGLAFADGRIFASTGRGEVLGLDAGTGHILWRQPLDNAARSAPGIADGRVFVSTIDDRMLGFDAAKGDKLWSYQAQTASAGLLGQPAPAIGDGLVVAGFSSGDLVALHAESGSLVWSDNLGSTSGRDSLVDLSSIRGMPVIANHIVYAIGLGGLMVAMDLRSGRRVWERDISGGDTPWLAGEWLFVVDADQVLAALSTTDGKVRWVSELPRYQEPKKRKNPIFWRGPVLVGGKLILVGNTGQLIVVDPQTGHQTQTMDLADAAPLSPVVADGTIYVVTDDGSLTAYR